MLFLSTEFLLIFMGMKPKVVMQVERGFSVLLAHSDNGIRTLKTTHGME